MSAFGKFLLAKREFSISGIRFIALNETGGQLKVAQTHYHPAINGGDTVPAFSLVNNSGLWSTVSTGSGSWINLNSGLFDTLYAEFMDSLNAVPVEVPETNPSPTQADLDAAIAKIVELNQSVLSLRAVLAST